MDNIADLIVEVLLAEGFELEQIEEFIESEEFDAFADVLLEEIAEEELTEGKSRLVRLGKAIGDELGIRKPRPDEKIWGATRGKNFRNTAGHMAAQATMGGAAGAAWYGSGKAAAVGAGIATAGGLALQVRDRYKYLKNIGEGAEISHWNKSRSDKEKTVKDRLEDKKAKAKKAKENGDWPAFKAYRKGDNLKETIEESLKVGDKVKALKGPHKGQTHTVIHVHDDGCVNIKPETRTCHYKLGAAKADPSEVEKLNEGVLSNVTNRLTGRREATRLKAGFKAVGHYGNATIRSTDASKKIMSGDREARASAKTDIDIANKHIAVGDSMQRKYQNFGKTKNYFKGIKEEADQVEEGVLRTIDKALGSPLQKSRIKKKLNTAGYKLLGKNNKKYTGSEEQQDRMRTLVKRHPTYMKWKKQGHVNGTITVAKEDFEGLDIKGLTEELLMEIKMKLKPGQKMTPKQFAKMKAEVLAKQKEDKVKKEAKKAAPKEEKKDEKVDTDDTNRNARILKGQFPWGNVSQTLANSALAKLKQIPKPEDRLNAMDAIWDHSKHFHDLIRNGKVDYKKEKEKGKITLPKVKGVTE